MPTIYSMAWTDVNCLWSSKRLVGLYKIINRVVHGYLVKTRHCAPGAAHLLSELSS
jgi:hypothetical protein